MNCRKKMSSLLYELETKMAKWDEEKAKANKRVSELKTDSVSQYHTILNIKLLLCISTIKKFWILIFEFEIDLCFSVPQNKTCDVFSP